MQPNHADYLYTLALMAMTFVGFTAIVMILRQSLGGALSPFDALVTRFFMAWGFLIAYGALAPPLLLAFALSPALTWAFCSLAAGLMLLALSFGYPWLRARATREKAPPFVYGQSALGAIIALALIISAVAPLTVADSAAIYLAALTATLAQASVGFIVTINVMLGQGKPK